MLNVSPLKFISGLCEQESVLKPGERQTERQRDYKGTICSFTTPLKI